MGCDSKDESGIGSLDSNTQIVLTFVTQNNGTSTRSAADDPDGYEEGVEYENDIDFSGSDYKIYFFTNAATDTKGGTLIAEFTPEEISTDGSGSTYTTYTLKGKVPTALIGVKAFKVVMLANWGSENYLLEVTVGKTTIDDLCEGTFSATAKFTIGENNLIPFYGVQEYSGIEIREGVTTTLTTTPVRLLRAVAKVEVILTAESDVVGFDAVSIVNYNSTGYCAPWQVYKAEDYDTDYANWETDFTSLHLVNGANDTGSKTQPFTQISGATQDTRRIYLPEYDNSGNDYSYISLTVDGEPYEIYFAEYTDGVTDNTTLSNRYDIKRNNLYRFYVTLKDRELRVYVETWDEVFDNEWSFGELAHLIYADDDINYFTADDGYIYASLVVEGEEENPTVYLQKVSQSTTGYVRIPETITYMGYTYTVIGIGSYSFDADQDVTFIDIPATVTYIEKEAFHGDTGLEAIAVHSEEPPTCAEDAFDGDDLNTIILYVPTNAVEKYSTTSPWSSFKNIVGIDFVQ